MRVGVLSSHRYQHNQLTGIATHEGIYSSAEPPAENVKQVSASMSTSSCSRPRTSSRPAFGLLWAGQGVSEFGTAIAGLALPLLAALHLGADSVQLGWLGAAAMLPALAARTAYSRRWMDRVPARPVIASTAAATRAAATLLIPALWLAGSLSLSRLYLLVAVIGLAQVFFETAWAPRCRGWWSMRPLAAHSRLELVRSATSVGGPGVAGLLIRAVGPAAALVVDARAIRSAPPRPGRALPHGPATVGDQPREPLLTPAPGSR